MAMRRVVGTGLAFGVALLGSASTGRAQDAGCCRTECHHDDGGVAVMLRAATQADCVAPFASCTVFWQEGACPEPPKSGAYGYGVGPGRPGVPNPSPPEAEPQE